MNAMYDSKAVPLDAYLGAFAWSEEQAGVAFAIGTKAMGLDLMDDPNTLRALFPKLLRSYAMDAPEAPDSAAATGIQMTNFLARIGKADCLVRPAVGIGENVRVTGKGISGAALWAERYVHVCAFTVNGNGGARQLHTRISQPTRRRREPRQQ